MASQTVSGAPLAERTTRRIRRRLMPYLFTIYVIAFLDRINVSYATLEMNKELGFTPEVYGIGAGIFFFGYVLLEIPGGLIVEKWGARRWIARIMVTWGIIAVGMGFIQTSTHFYVLRFLLGLAEAGFYPAVVVYISHWFRYEDRARTMAMFLAAIPISNIIGSPISGVLLGLNWFGLSGWRWVFIIEGAPAIIFGVITLYYLTDWPRDAKWLSSEERQWIISELEGEKQRKQQVRSYSIWEAFRHRQIIFMICGYFLIVTTGYGLSFWMPTIVKNLSGGSNLVVGFINTLPSCVGLTTLLVMGWSSDRTKERTWHTAIPMMVAGLGCLLLALLQDYAVLAIAMIGLAYAGVSGYQPSFWSLPGSFLTGTAAAATIGLINTIGSLGGFVGPSLVGYLNEKTNSFFASMLCLAVFAMLAGCCILVSARPVKDHRATVEAAALSSDTQTGD